MPRQAKRSEPKEILRTLNKLWLNTEDIRIVASVGVDRAREIKNTISKQLLNDGWYLPTGMVPSAKVVEYLKIDLKYLEKISSKVTERVDKSENKAVS